MAKNLYLAQELLSEIIGHLHPDEWDVPWIDAPENKRDFYSCSLVSHAWNAATKPHLFRDIAYSFREEDKCAPYETQDNEEEFKLWRLFVLTRQLVRYKTIRMLCTFLRKNPGIQPYVRHLKLELWPSRKPLDPSEWKLGPEDEIDASLFGDLLALLPQLTVLHLHNVFVSKLPKSLSPVTRIQLQRLHIATSSIQNEHESKTLWVGPTSVLDHTLVFFGEIGELHLSTWELYDATDLQETDVETGNEPTTMGLSVRHLVLDGLKREPRQLQRLLEHSVSRLRRLTFLANDSGSRLNPAISERFMHFVAAHIEELDIFVGRGREGYMCMSWIFSRRDHLTCSTDSDGVEFTNVAVAQLTNSRKLRIGIVLSASNGSYAVRTVQKPHTAKLCTIPPLLVSATLRVTTL